MSNGYGPENSNWGGDSVNRDGGRQRARRMYPSRPCEVCGKKKTDRHHVDDNTLNNNASNIKFLCRKHHMEADSRLKNLIELNKNRPVRDTKSGYTGVYQSKRGGRWRAMARVNGERKYIGSFSTPEDAATAIKDVESGSL